jgi:hypothetical protein
MDEVQFTYLRQRDGGPIWPAMDSWPSKKRTGGKSEEACSDRSAEEAKAHRTLF